MATLISATMPQYNRFATAPRPLATLKSSTGDEGWKIFELFQDIAQRWREPLPRSLTPQTLWIEPDPAQAVANQAAIALLRSWQDAGDVQEQRETLADLQSYTDGLYTGFHPIEQVQSVYIQPLPEVYNVFVFLNQSHYDDAVMDTLLDKEADILDRYPETLFNFHYLPLLNAVPTVPNNAALIFSR